MDFFKGKFIKNTSYRKRDADNLLMDNLVLICSLEYHKSNLSVKREC